MYKVVNYRAITTGLLVLVLASLGSNASALTSIDSIEYAFEQRQNHGLRARIDAYLKNYRNFDLESIDEDTHSQDFKPQEEVLFLNFDRKFSDR